MRTVAIINQKGGSGKTTTAINLAAALARRGFRTLLADLDPQSHCALGLAIPESHIDLQMGDALLAPDHRPVDLSRLIWHVSKGLHLIPSTTKLAGLEAARGGLADRDDRDTRLAALLTRVADQYDWGVIDCPPSIGLLTYNALRAAGEILIPVETAFFALQGAGKQVSTIRAMCRRFGASIPFHILATIHDDSSTLAADVLHELRRRFERQMIPVVIRNDPKLKEAASLGVSIHEYDASSHGSTDYVRLAGVLASSDRPSSRAHSPHDAEPEWKAEPRPDSQESKHQESSRAVRHAADAAGPDAGVAIEEYQPTPALSGSTRTNAPMTRAAELAARARRLAFRSAELSRHLDADPEVARVMREVAQPDQQTPRHTENDRAQHLPSLRRIFGARQTPRGVLFVHPGGEGVTVCVAGDHNSWSPTASPMRYNPEVDLHEACLPLEPGRYRYRLVVNGQWIADPYNPLSEPNPFGQRDSVVIVEVAPAASLAAL